MKKIEILKMKQISNIIFIRRLLFFIVLISSYFMNILKILKNSQGPSALSPTFSATNSAGVRSMSLSAGNAVARVPLRLKTF
jgi:hypothetical protein